jgi:serine/threonine protein phosphatase 1
MPRNFVIGDIHGAFRALKQCLERAEFDYDNDMLISLGDVCDGWPDTKDCVDELLKVKNLIYILGNHDLWALDWMRNIDTPPIWLTQGGDATVKSYRDGVPNAHLVFFEKALPYYILDNKLFVHAGINPEYPIEKQGLDIFLWDRNLAYMVLDLYQKKILVRLTKYDEIYIGHTPVSSGRPIHSCEVWLMDTGAGWAGPLTMMNIETKEIFMSDAVPTLYPGIKGRTRGR